MEIVCGATVFALLVVAAAVAAQRSFAARSAPSPRAGFLIAAGSAAVSCALLGNLSLRITDFYSACFVLGNAAFLAIIASEVLYIVLLYIRPLTRAGARARLAAAVLAGFVGAGVVVTSYYRLQSPSVVLRRGLGASLPDYGPHVSHSEARVVLATGYIWLYVVRLDMDADYIPTFCKALWLSHPSEGEATGPGEIWKSATMPTEWRSDMRPQYYYESTTLYCPAYITPEGHVYLLIAQ